MNAKTPGNIHIALMAAQAEMPRTVKKGSDNPHFKSKYASLEDVVAAVGPHLNKHGIAYYHNIQADEPFSFMRTSLVHAETGTTIECDVPLIVSNSKQDMQGFKSACTYAKRIGLESVTGVAPSDDDDGNAAAAASPPKSAYALKNKGKHDGNTDWDKVMMQLSVELGDIPETKRNRDTLVELRSAYMAEAKERGWTQTWVDCLDEEFIKIAAEWDVGKKPENVLEAG